MIMTLLGMWLWSQPRTNSTTEIQRQHSNLNLDAIVRPCYRLVNGIREAIAARLWKTWILTLQILFVGVNELLYCKTPRKRRRKSSPHWQHAVARFKTLMSALGDWILVQTKPSNCRRRRIIATAYRYRRTTQFVAMSVLAMQAYATVSTERETCFDTDSSDIGIDNRCSACISHVESDFEGPLVHCNRVVKGFGGSRTRNVKMGTLKWIWEDDQGVATTFRIPNSYYVPNGGVRLLSPQHWAQTQQSKSSRFAKFAKRASCECPLVASHCGETTDSNRRVLYWNNGANKL